MNVGSDPSYWANAYVLTSLYIIQAIPLGLSMSTIPLLLKIQNVSYGAIGFFAISAAPYSLKLLWSPVVDSVFSKKIGRRKSWIIPVQILSGCIMLWISLSIDRDFETTNHFPIYYLTSIFCLLTFLSATQDIAVDDEVETNFMIGWGLDMFDAGDRHTCSTCQSIGISAGFFCSFTIFLFLNSVQFCNSYLRYEPSNKPLVTLGSYLTFWGFVYIFSSLALFFYPENSYLSEFDADSMTPGKVFKQIIEVIKLDNMKKLIPILLLNRMGIMVSSLFQLQVTDITPQHIFAYSSVISFPLELLAVLYLFEIIKEKNLDIYLETYKFTLIWSLVAIFYLLTLPAKDPSSFQLFFIVLLIIIFKLLRAVVFISIQSFFSSISDATIGGTYLTLINTVSNFGGAWPDTVVPVMIDLFTITRCNLPYNSIFYSAGHMHCSSVTNKQECASLGGICSQTVNGFYVTSFFCILFGVATYFVMRKRLLPLQFVPVRSWFSGYDLEKGALKCV